MSDSALRQRQAPCAVSGCHETRSTCRRQSCRRRTGTRSSPPDSERTVSAPAARIRTRERGPHPSPAEHHPVIAGVHFARSSARRAHLPRAVGRSRNLVRLWWCGAPELGIGRRVTLHRLDPLEQRPRQRISLEPRVDGTNRSPQRGDIRRRRLDERNSVALTNSLNCRTILRLKLRHGRAERFLGRVREGPAVAGRQPLQNLAVPDDRGYCGPERDVRGDRRLP